MFSIFHELVLNIVRCPTPFAISHQTFQCNTFVRLAHELLFIFFLHLQINSANNNNYNVNGFEYECSHGTATSKSSSSSSSLQKQQQMPPPTLSKQSTNLHGNGCDEITLHNQHKELVQSRTKCKQSQARTNSVYHHTNGIGTTAAATTTTATMATHLTPTPSNHQLAHVINSLSSPESAYSTGYSTDGTSPSGI